MTESEAREMARDLVRGSIIEDAAAQFIAQILKHAHDERIKPLKARAEAAEAEVEKLRGALSKLHHAVCGETGFAACVRLDSGKAYPWPALDEADADARAVLTTENSHD